jgi:hypothetical protein
LNHSDADQLPRPIVRKSEEVTAGVIDAGYVTLICTDGKSPESATPRLFRILIEEVIASDERILEKH